MNKDQGQYGQPYTGTWVCPSCQSVNTATTCRRCGLIKPGTENHTTVRTNPPVQNNKLLYIVIGALAAIVVILAVMLLIPKNSPTPPSVSVNPPVSTTPPAAQDNWVEEKPTPTEAPAPQHEHSWMDATCRSPMTCSICGESAGGLASHTWEDATCISPKNCIVCGETVGNLGAHTWEDMNLILRRCTLCGEEDVDLPENFDIQPHLKTATDVFSEVYGMIPEDELENIQIAAGHNVFKDEDGNVRLYVVHKGYGSVGGGFKDYKRSYFYTKSGELVFALYEGETDHRCYFYKGSMIRWHFTDKAADINEKRDLVFDNAYLDMEDTILREAEKYISRR